jgi:hypothetical protein
MLSLDLLASGPCVFSEKASACVVAVLAAVLAAKDLKDLAAAADKKFYLFLVLEPGHECYNRSKREGSSA